MPVIRVRAPARHAGIEVLQGNKADEIDFTVLERCDAITIQRDFPRFPGYDDLIRLARDKRIPVIYECDDMILEVPRRHISRSSYIDVLFRILKAASDADVVTVSTPQLFDYFKPFNNNVKLFPNYLDDMTWNLNRPQKLITSGQAIRIGYMGGASHAPDLESVAPVLLKLISKYKRRIRFNFWGVRPAKVMMDLDTTSWKPMNILDYQKFVTKFSDCESDIWIAPLQHTDFNQYKSAIKYLEYTAVGGAGVYSREKPYTDIVVHEHNGLLASSENEWFDMLSRLIEDPEYRLKVSTGAQRTLSRDWLLSSNYHKWADIVQKLDETEKVSQKSPSLETVFRIASQVEEYQSEQAALISKLKIDNYKKMSVLKHQDLVINDQKRLINRLNRQIHKQGNRILEYQAHWEAVQNSRSWKIMNMLDKFLIKARIKSSKKADK